MAYEAGWRTVLRRAAAPALLSLISLGLIYSLATTSRSVELAEHARQVSLAARELQQLVVDAETGQRAYIATGDERFLEPFTRARASWNDQLGRVAELIRADPGQEESVRRLKPLLDEKWNEMEATIGLHDAGVRGEPLTAAMLRGRDTMDAVRRALAAIEAEAHGELLERQAAAAAHFRWALAFLVGAALAFAVVAGTLSLQRRYEALRREAVEAERRLLQGVLAGIDDGFTVQDPGGELVFANASAARLVGLPSAEVMLTIPTRQVFARFEVFAEDGSPFPFERLPSRAVLAGAPGDAAVVRHRIAGTNDDRWSHVRAYPVLDADGKLARVINVFRDVTEETAVAREKVRLLRELEETVARERTAREQAEQAVRFSELFVGIVGHDLRSPLSAIGLAADVMLSSTADDRVRRAATRIASSSQRMARMIEQLMELTRIRLGQGLAVRPAAVDLEALAQQIAEETEVAHGCSIHVAALGDLRGAWDADRLGQVLSNLLANAAVHGAKGRLVFVQIDGREPPVVRLTVRNDGEIPAELVPAIFEPFHGNPEKRGAARGLGLGLYITREIVRAHGGIIGVECEGGGTAFRIELPRGLP